MRYLWDEERLEATFEKVLFGFPAGVRHTTRTIAFNNQGQMFVSIGSTCDVCFEQHPWHGTVIVSDQEGNNPRVFAKGLRNAVFITTQPETDELWATEMGRDFLGDDLPLDEINIILEGRDYGWPRCYGQQIQDQKFDPSGQAAIFCQTTQASTYDLQAHSAPLGLAFINSPQFPDAWQGDLLVAYHGSWNRSVHTGYKVVRLTIENNQIIGEEDFLTGFLQGSSALGRPVDLLFDQSGQLFLSDDQAGTIYQITK